VTTLLLPRRNRLFGYFALAHAITWGGILLLLAIMMHASYTGWLLVLSTSTSFEQGLVWQATFAVGLWLVVAVVTRWQIPSASASGQLHTHCHGGIQ
jgi:hypothetical protein